MADQVNTSCIPPVDLLYINFYDALQADTTRVIWAYKGTDLTESGGSLYHGTLHRGSKSIFLLNPQSVPPEMPEDVVTIEFRNDDVNMIIINRLIDSLSHITITGNVLSLGKESDNFL